MIVRGLLISRSMGAYYECLSPRDAIQVLRVLDLISTLLPHTLLCSEKMLISHPQNSVGVVELWWYPPSGVGGWLRYVVLASRRACRACTSSWVGVARLWSFWCVNSDPSHFLFMKHVCVCVYMCFPSLAGHVCWGGGLLLVLLKLVWQTSLLQWNPSKGLQHLRDLQLEPQLSVSPPVNLPQFANHL